MPPFLPIQAISRSQAVRIGGQTIKRGVTSYVDFGNLLTVEAVPTLVVTEKTGKASQQHAGSNAKALVKSKYFGYAVSAVDASGVATPASQVVQGKTEAGAESESNLNFITVNWTAVPNATSYNVYRVGESQTGIASTILAETGTLQFLANVTAVTYQDTGVEVTAQVPVTSNKTNRYSKQPFSPFKELQNHLAIGAIITVGDLTQSNSDWVVVTIGGFAITFGSEEVKLATGELRQRSSGFRISIAGATYVSKEAASGKEIKSYVVYNTQTHKITLVEGTAETVAKAVLPALPANSVVLFTVAAIESKMPVLLTNYLQFP